MMHSMYQQSNKHWIVFSDTGEPEVGYRSLFVCSSIQEAAALVNYLNGGHQHKATMDVMLSGVTVVQP